LTRLVAAISVFALEMQVATWTGLATIRTLFLVNAALLVVAFALGRSATPDLPNRPLPPSGTGSVAAGFALYLAAAGAMALLVLVVNVVRPLEAADPYHLERVAQIQRLGTLAYEPLNPDPKVNVLGWTYELVLADVDQIPLIGQMLLRVHGLFGLALYLLAIGASQTWFGTGRPPSRFALGRTSGWCRAAVFTVPVVFHQFVLVKNDLFGAVPALVVLAWLVMRSQRATGREILWAAFLTGFAVAIKLTSAPLALVFAGWLFVERHDRRRVLPLIQAGGLIGAICGGLGFTMIENQRWYGNPLAVDDGPFSENGNATLADVAVSVWRFTISLFDLGLVTRTMWPGRGGWGATFGLPIVWAIAVLLLRCRANVTARRALWISGTYFLLFAAIYTDADIAHRLALAPGLLLIVAAISLSEGEDRTSRGIRVALAVVMVLSAAQILRSATLYLTSA
jgi:hypothetical protein